MLCNTCIEKAILFVIFAKLYCFVFIPDLTSILNVYSPKVKAICMVILFLNSFNTNKEVS